jgi:hypothetical protein
MPYTKPSGLNRAITVSRTSKSASTKTHLEDGQNQPEPQPSAHALRPATSTPRGARNRSLG